MKNRKINLVTIGNFLGDLFILQILFLFYSIKGGILFGIFPAFVSTIKVIVEYFYNENPNTIYIDFKNTYKENFKIANILGYILAFTLFILYLDIKINNMYLENNLVNIVLSILIILVLICITHIPLVILRFKLKLKDYFTQSLLISLINPINTISILISFYLLELIFSNIGILIFLAVPLISIPIAWFANNSINKILHDNTKI